MGVKKRGKKEIRFV